MNKYFLGLISVTLLIGIAVVLGFVRKSQSHMVVSNPIVRIDVESKNKFVSEKDIKEQIHFLSDTTSFLMNEISVSQLEEKLNRNSSIKSAHVYKTINGKLVVDVEQRKPIARIFSNGDGYYLDEVGNLMPLSNKYTARVPVVSGFLEEPYAKRYTTNYDNIKDSLAKKTLLDDVYQMAKYIHKSAFWAAQIEQLYVNKDLEFELIPKVGNHKIVFGGADGLEGKFEKLMLFYEKGLSKTGWNEYSLINLKYRNQVVGTKIFD